VAVVVAAVVAAAAAPSATHLGLQLHRSGTAVTAAAMFFDFSIAADAAASSWRLPCVNRLH
jgi:archaellum component FlaG (FlaF/FlaG flagellin family)